MRRHSIGARKRLGIMGHNGTPEPIVCRILRDRDSFGAFEIVEMECLLAARV